MVANLEYRQSPWSERGPGIKWARNDTGSVIRMGMDWDSTLGRENKKNREKFYNIAQWGLATKEGARHMGKGTEKHQTPLFPLHPR